MTSNQHHFSVPQRSLWKRQASSFHLEILSDLLSSSPSDEGPVCTGLCFIWISKPVRRCSNILNSIFGAFFKECDYFRVLVEGIWSLGQCWLCAGRVMVSFIWCLETRWAQQRICISVRSSFRLLSSDGVWEIVHIFWPSIQTTTNVPLTPSEPCSCLLSCIHSINERHTGVTVAVWHLLTQCLGICYGNNLCFVCHISVYV